MDKVLKYRAHTTLLSETFDETLFKKSFPSFFSTLNTALKKSLGVLLIIMCIKKHKPMSIFLSLNPSTIFVFFSRRKVLVNGDFFPDN